MLPDYLISFFKIFLVAVLLLAMIIILLGINHVTHNDDTLTEEETMKLKKDVKKDKMVITSGNVFHKFLARNTSKRMPDRP